MLQLNTIRYMGIKTKLLNEIIPYIIEITPKNGTVCDLMAGSCTVSYALKEYFNVYTNDVQQYSYIISKATIENNKVSINKKSAEDDIFNNFQSNIKNKYFHLFEDIYSNTYFSKKQCLEIDSIRYAIEQIKSEEKYCLYLTALMCAMCTAQSTPGHFAQFMPSNHKRVIPLQAIDIYDEFLKKCDNYSSIYQGSDKNKSFCFDYKILFKTNLLESVNTIYLDSPYSQEQYSRFYHILETLVKYDYPEVSFKAKYRNDRFMSKFCYKKNVSDEFKEIINYCFAHNINLLISYSNKALLPIEDLENICKSKFSSVETKYISYSHSTQGKGKKDLEEVLIKCKI